MNIEAIITLILSGLAMLASGAAWLAGARRRKAETDAAGIENWIALSKRLTELENERESDYQERATMQRKMWQLERDYEILKRQNERLRADVMKLVRQIRKEGLEPAVVPEDYED